MLAAYEARTRGALLHIVSAYEVPPSAGWVVVPLGPFEESADAIISQSLTKVQDRYPDLVTKGEHRHGFAGIGAGRGSEGCVTARRRLAGPLRAHRSAHWFGLRALRAPCVVPDPHRALTPWSPNDNEVMPCPRLSREPLSATSCRQGQPPLPPSAHPA